MQIRMNDLDARMQRIERVMTNQSLLEMAQRIDALQAELRTMRVKSSSRRTKARAARRSPAAFMATSKSASPRSKRWAVSVPAAIARREQRGQYASHRKRGRHRRRAGELRRGVQRIEGFRLSTRHLRIPQLRRHLSEQPTREQCQYWLGEAYYVNKEYQNAIAAFQKVTTDWPDSRKAPDALVKIGSRSRQWVAMATRGHAGRRGAPLSRHRGRAARDGALEAPARQCQMSATAEFESGGASDTGAPPQDHGDFLLAAR